MEYVWITCGIVLILYALLDTFFTVLNYNERGLLINRLVGVEWAIIRALTSRASGKTRRFVYRQMTGVIFVSVVLWWAAALIFGFALIFHGANGLGAMRADPTAPTGFPGAIYFSIAEFSSVGVADMAPTRGWVGLLSVIETLIALIVLTMVITFLFNVFKAIQALRTLCASFPAECEEVTAPAQGLRPFIGGGLGAAAIEAHLIGIRQAFSAYFDALAQDHLAYYFQSGVDRFALPFAVYQVGGTWESLWVGFDEDHAISQLPEMQVLHAAVFRTQRQIYRRYLWKLPAAPEPLDFDQFQKQLNATPTDPLLARFQASQRQGAALVGTEPSQPTRGTYEKYRLWLPFTTMIDDFVGRTSHELGYRPTCVGLEQTEVSRVQAFGWNVTTVTAPQFSMVGGTDYTKDSDKP